MRKPFAQRQALEKFFAEAGYAQFGQQHDASTDNGREGCTHTVWQAIVKIYRGKDLSHDELSGIAGYRPEDDGMNSTHCDRIIAHFKLPYVASFHSGRKLPAGELLRIAREVGPVLVAVDYGLYPLQKGLGGGGNTALQGGRNDLGFAGNHAVLMFSAKWRRKVKEYRPRIMDPDHGSPARPDVPKFDIITQGQFSRMWNSNLVGKPYGQFAYIPLEQPEVIP